MASFSRRILRPKRNRSTQPKALGIGQYPNSIPLYTWISNPGLDDPLPSGVVFAGTIETGEKSYIGRAFIVDQEACGFFTDEDRRLRVPYGGDEHVLDDFEVLIVENQETLLWLRCARASVPSNFLTPLWVTNNMTETDHFVRENMIVGRSCTPLTDGVTYDGRVLELSRYTMSGQNVCRPGKIHTSHHCLYVPYSGREYIFTDHEMLMLKRSPGQLKQICRYVILKSIKPYPSSVSVNKLPLPSKLKAYLGKEPDYYGNIP